MYQFQPPNQDNPDGNTKVLPITLRSKTRTLTIPNINILSLYWMR